MSFTENGRVPVSTMKLPRQATRTSVIERGVRRYRLADERAVPQRRLTWVGLLRGEHPGDRELSPRKTRATIARPGRRDILCATIGPVMRRYRWTVAGTVMCLVLAGTGTAIWRHSNRPLAQPAAFVAWQSGKRTTTEQKQYFADSGKPFRLAFEVRNRGTAALRFRSTVLGARPSLGVVYFDDIRESSDQVRASLPGRGPQPIGGFRLEPGQVATVIVPVAYDVCRFHPGSYSVNGIFIRYLYAGASVNQAVAFVPPAQLVAGVPCH